jgi:hypothetical protein
VPATEVELNNRNEALQRIVNVRHGQESLWVCHKAGGSQLCKILQRARCMYFVILSSIDLSSRMNVGSVTLLRSAPGLN